MNILLVLFFINIFIVAVRNLLKEFKKKKANTALIVFEIIVMIGALWWLVKTFK